MSRHIFLKIDDKFLPFDPLAIKLIQANGDYVKIIMANGKKFLKRCTMEYIEKKFDYDFICRTDRSYIVNVSYVKEIGSNVISFDDCNVPLDKKYAAVFMQRFMPLD